MKIARKANVWKQTLLNEASRFDPQLEPKNLTPIISLNFSFFFNYSW